MARTKWPSDRDRSEHSNSSTEVRSEAWFPRELLKQNTRAVPVASGYCREASIVALPRDIYTDQEGVWAPFPPRPGLSEELSHH